MDKVRLENTNLMLQCHDEGTCFGEVCSLHNRTDHHMRSWPQNWRGDRYMMERVCPHGVGHPDPDDYSVVTGRDSGVHGCDGCCAEADTEPLQISHSTAKKNHTHDPLCPWYGSTEFETVVGCDDCDLIAKVREDERDNCWVAVAEMEPRDFGELGDFKAWIEKPEALAAIEALDQEKP